MFQAFMKKQVLLFLRRPQEVLILLLMPFVLITILGFALSPIMESDEPALQIKVAIVEHTNEQQELEALTKRFGEIPNLQSLLPIHLLKEQLFKSEEVKSFITLEEISLNKLEQAKKDSEYDAIIEVPEHFTTETIEAIFSGNKKQPELIVYMNEKKNVSTNVVQSIIESFQQQYSRMALLGKSGLSVEPVKVNVNSEIRTIDNRKPIGAQAYYAIGMSVMFVLFVASSASTIAYREKYLHLFDRILLANVSRWTYLFSIFASTMLLVVLQLIILFGGTYVIYGVKFPDVSSFLLVTCMLSFVIGSISTLLTSINYRANSLSASNMFQSVFVTTLAFLGGSFMDVSSISDFFNMTGNLTPNGAAMSAYIKLMQGDSVVEISNHLYVLGILAIVLFAVAVLLFPKKGGVA